MNDKFSSNAQQFKSEIETVLLGRDPYFLSRIGGSDTDALVDYIRLRDTDEEALEKHLSHYLPIVERFNGFYDASNNEEHKRSLYLKYLSTLEDLYRQTRLMTCCHPHTLSLFFRDVMHDRFVKDEFYNKAYMFQFLMDIASSKDFVRAYPYNFVEGIVQNPFTLFWVLAKVLNGRKVLAVTPFSKSIMHNFPNRRNFFRNNYLYPDFQIETVNVPITYYGIDRSLYPDSDWFATVSRMKNEIRNRDFDIALLSCGSYAMPLGFYIQQELGRHAVYVGGVLQLFFGIMGRRYRNVYFENQLNTERFIEPIEKELYAPFIPKGDDAAREAFGAYF